MAKSKEIKIDDGFMQLLPELTEEEARQLETNLIAEGRALDPLKVWKEENTLLDGHNRLNFCELNNLEYEIEYISLTDRQAALRWIYQNQKGRRNMTVQALRMIRGTVYNTEKADHGGDRKSKGQNDLLKNTAEKVGEEFGVSEKTIKRDGKFAEAVNALPVEDRKEVLSGKKKLQVQDKKTKNPEKEGVLCQERINRGLVSAVLFSIQKSLESIPEETALAMMRKAISILTGKFGAGFTAKLLE